MTVPLNATPPDSLSVIGSLVSLSVLIGSLVVGAAPVAFAVTV